MALNADHIKSFMKILVLKMLSEHRLYVYVSTHTNYMTSMGLVRTYHYAVRLLTLGWWTENLV